MGVYDQERENMVRWDGRQTPFFEAYRLKVNLAPSPHALWLRFALLAPRKTLGSPTASLSALFYDIQNPPGSVALKRTYNIDQTQIDRDIFYFQIQDSSIYNSGSRGQISSGGHEIHWDVEFVPNEASFKLYPQSFYYLPIPRTKILSPNWSFRAKGEIKLDGKTYPFSDCPGSQAHLWGTHYAEKWFWGHCNGFQEDPQACFEAMSFPLRWGKRLQSSCNLIALRLGDGREFIFNRMVHWFLNRSRGDLSKWELKGQKGLWRLKAEMQNPVAGVLGVTYTDADGSKRYAYHSEAADFRVELFEHKTKQPSLILTSQKSGTFEVLDRTPLPDIPLKL